MSKFTIALLLISAAVVGGVAGFLTGASSTPIVNTVLPLLFVLLGGSGGIYLARLNLDEPQSRTKVALISAATIAMMLPFAAALGLGISLRMADKPLAALPIPKHYFTSDLVELILLEKKLEIIGLEKTRIQKILAAASAEISKRRGYVATEMISKNHKDASRALEQLVQLAKVSTDVEIQKQTKKTIMGFRIFIRFLEPFREKKLHPNGMPYELYRRAALNVWFHLDSLSIPTWAHISSWQLKFAQSNNPLHEIYGDLYGVTRRDEEPWNAAVESVDKLTQILSGTKIKQENETEVLPAIE